MTASKLVLNAASGASGGDTTDVDDVFSTFVYQGNSTFQAIENGIALGNSGEGGSVDFSAGSTTRIALPASSDFGFGTGDWTIEYFIFISDNYNYTEHVDFRTSSQNSTHTVPIIYSDSSGTLYFFTASNNRITSSSGALSEGVFHHIAVAKSGSTTKMFINGTQAGSDYTDNNDYAAPANAWSIGGSLEQNNYNARGFMSNVRIVKGTALYTSNFTAPTSALTAVTNTKLLTLQGSTPFVDNSGNSHTITQNGSPAAFDFGPFTGSSGEGGLIWTKERTGAQDHTLFDTERGTNRINTNNTSAQFGDPDGVRAFNSNGYVISSGGDVNDSGDDFVSWTFRKAPKFFDVVTYTGNLTAGKTVSHNLGTVPGMIIIKNVSSTKNWIVYHRSAGEGKFIKLNDVDGEISNTYNFNNTAPTSTQFTLGESSNTNTNGDTHVAYLFAHNNNDGGFGPNRDQDIIKCGTYTGTGSNIFVDLGFEPQFFLTKRTDTNGSWFIVDNMRGMRVDLPDPYLVANGADSETNTGANGWHPSPTGITIQSTSQIVSGANYVYMAIRRGPLTPPTDAADVFKATVLSSSYFANTGFDVDLSIDTVRASTGSNFVNDRLRGDGAYMNTDGTTAEQTGGSRKLDSNRGVRFVTSGSGVTGINWAWKRAPEYFDMVAYTGTGSNRTIAHNLGAVPEMMWLKERSGTFDWNVYHKDLGGANKYLHLNATDAVMTATNRFNNTHPTASVFSLGTSSALNDSSATHICYLFASLAGVSKVGSYTGNGSTQNIDCGFSSGARFVLIKRTDTSNSWYVHDTARGIVSGNDPYLVLNGTDPEEGAYDLIDPYSSGFQLVNSFSGWNANGGSYIFYAIA